MFLLLLLRGYCSDTVICNPQVIFLKELSIARYSFTSDMQDYNSHVIVGGYFKSSYLAMTLTLLISISPAGVALPIQYFLLITGRLIKNKKCH
jgi:hypothetical protein